MPFKELLLFVPAFGLVNARFHTSLPRLSKRNTKPSVCQIVLGSFESPRGMPRVVATMKPPSGVAAAPLVSISNT